MKINDVLVNIQKSWYNKTKVAEDGVTHHIDTSTQYPLHHLNISKTYFDIEDRLDVVDEVIKDLTEVIEHLQHMKEAELHKTNEREERE